MLNDKLNKLEALYEQIEMEESKLADEDEELWLCLHTHYKPSRVTAWHKDDNTNECLTLELADDLVVLKDNIREGHKDKAIEIVKEFFYEGY